MVALQQGDCQAFSKIVERHQGRLVGYLTRLTGDLDRAEDLAQEAFLRLFRSVDSYRPQGQLSAYLFRIATNLLRSEERRRTRWRHLEPIFRSGQRLQASPTAPDELLGSEIQRRLRRAIAALPLTYRLPLVLYEMEDWSCQEISQLLNCREGTIKSRLFRARQKLKETMTPYWKGGTE